MRRLLAWLLLVGVVVGPPALLLVVGYRDWGSIDLFLAGDARLVLAALTLVAWAGWALWVVVLAAELTARLTSGRTRLRLPGLRLPQFLASALVTAALASTAASATAHAAPVAVSAAVQPAVALSAPASPLAQQPTGASGPGHRVAPGEDLWSLAERYYDDGREWRRIVAANPAVAEDPTADLPPGTWLSVPNPVKLVTVVKGDTLSGLALEHLGDGRRWPEIHALNKARIANPDLIHVGWVLKVPRLLPAAEAETVAPASAALVVGPSTGGDGAALSAPAEAAADTTADAATHHPDTPVPATDATDSPETAVAEAASPEAGGEGSEHSPAAVVAVVGGLSSVTASMVMGALAMRRALRDRARPPGRRFAPAEPPLQRVEAAMGVHQAPGRELLIDRALRHLAAHWHAEQVRAPKLTQAIVSDLALEFTFDRPTSGPVGFQTLGADVVVGWSTLESLDDIDHPAAFPALVTLGSDDRGDLVMIDLVGAGMLGVRERAAGLASESLSGMLIELTCAPWNDQLELLVVTDDDAFVRAAGGDAVRVESDPEVGVRWAERWAHERRARLGSADYDTVRLDPEVAEAWMPRIVLFEQPLAEALVARLDATLGDSCGVAAALPVCDRAGEAELTLCASPELASVIDSVRTPQTVPAETRRAIAGLLSNASDPTTSPAPWWTRQEDDVKIIELRPERAALGPVLKLLGPIELEGATGIQPERAARQCLEYCAWLLAHPGATSSMMLEALVVADSTRRSNMSRLRSWLGQDADGRPYLPDAYSGRITLDETVTSDWDHLRGLIAHGVARTHPDRLRQALELVRGAPLADAAPGQWLWAEEMRSDMVATIRDIAITLSTHARERGDLDLARWAVNRGLVVAPEDELMVAERIRVEHQAGHLEEVQRLVLRMTRSARVLGIDLLPETIDLCQEVMEGRRRVRHA